MNRVPIRLHAFFILLDCYVYPTKLKYRTAIDLEYLEILDINLHWYINMHNT